MNSYSIGGAIGLALDIFIWIIIIDVIFSWIVSMGKISSYHPIPKTLHTITSPLLNPIRRLLPAYRTGGLDLSPMILIMIIRMLLSAIH